MFAVVFGIASLAFKRQLQFYDFIFFRKDSISLGALNGISFEIETFLFANKYRCHGQNAALFFVLFYTNLLYLSSLLLFSVERNLVKFFYSSRSNIVFSLLNCYSVCFYSQNNRQ